MNGDPYVAPEYTSTVNSPPVTKSVRQEDAAVAARVYLEGLKIQIDREIQEALDQVKNGLREVGTPPSSGGQKP